MIRKKWLDLIKFAYKGRSMSFVTYHPSNKQTGHFMGRETVYLCYDFSEVLQSWWDRNANESRKRFPSTDKLGPRRRIQDVSPQISVTNCVPLRGYTTTHPITTKRGNVIALVMVITWLDFGKVLWKVLFWQRFYQNLGGCVLLKVKHYCVHNSGMFGLIDVKWKGSASLW